MTDVLEVRGIAVSYGDAQAVRDVSLTVKAGQITALIGSNGAGKTTTLHAIAGLLRVRTGTISVAGQDVTHRAASEMPAHGLSLVQQGKRIFPGMTVEENLLVATYPHKMRKAARLGLAAEAYERFPILADKRKAPAGSLSGGQQQMLAISQSLMARPKVLMLDEPSAGLAPALVKEVLQTVVTLAGDGLGVLLVEQLVEDALAIANDAVVLDEGTVSIAGDVASVSRDPRLMDAYLGPRLSTEGPRLR